MFGEKTLFTKIYSTSIKRRKYIITAIFIFFVFQLGGCSLWNMNSDKTASSEFDASLPYEYTKPKLNVSPTEEFTFKISYDPMKLESYKSGKIYTHHIAVYIDPALKVEAPDAFVNYAPGKIKIKPFSEGVRALDPTNVKHISLSKPNEWGFSDEYFIVQKADAKTGKTLEKPIVTRFTVKKNLEKPVASFSVDNDGIGHFKWEPVPDACRYYIIKSQEGLPGVDIIGSTTKSEWTTAEQDESFQKQISQNDVFSQNRRFQNFKISEDDLRDKDAWVTTSDQELRKNTYGIIAVSEEGGASAFSIVNEPSIEKMLPLVVAYNAVEEMKLGGRNIKTFDKIPTQLPITMADGSTVLRPVILDTKNVKIENHTIGNLDGKFKVKSTRIAKICVVPYVIEGTMLNNKYNIEIYDQKKYISEIDRITKRNKQAKLKTGGEVAYFYIAQRKDLSNEKISQTVPRVPYKINATNPITEYLAANMIAGNEFIDVSKYLDDTKSISINDAALEASYQNPYILGIEGVNYFSEQKVLEVDYKVSSREERIKEQEAISKEVDRVIAKIITKDMRDEQKVKAINDYIIETAEYDYVALESIDWFQAKEFNRAWTPSGILFDKKAVCGGYAVAFKVLADKAGLESVYVSGVTKESADPHAWNKVKVNGVWRVIDVTWNDSAKPNRYYLMTDKQANETRTQEDRFVVDIFVDRYAAN